MTFDQYAGIAMLIGAVILWRRLPRKPRRTLANGGRVSKVPKGG